MAGDGTEYAVSASHLVKVYSIPVRRQGFLGGVRQLFSRESKILKAVDDVSFEIPAGDFVGYIGPNGAGKSTTIKMLSGILHPSEGSVTVNGLSPIKNREAVCWNVGVVFGQRTQLWWDLPTADSFELLAAMYDVKRSDYLAFLKQFSEILGIDEFMDTPVRRLSLGQRMRADLAAALIHRPSVLFLDEPTIGLDVVGKSRIREFLQQINKERGVTTLLTTHDLRDIEELCRRVMVINHGRLIYDGELISLREHAGLPTVMTIKYAHLSPGLSAGQRFSADGALTSNSQADGWSVESVDYGSNRLSLSFDRSKHSAPQVLWAMRSLGQIDDVSLTEPLIEQIVRRLLC